MTSTKVVEGIPARLMGLVAMTPLPLAVVVIGAYVAMNVVNKTPEQAEKWATDNHFTLIGIEAGIVIGIAVLLGITAAILGGPPTPKARERYDEDDDFKDRYTATR
jgi:hypothetical protein